MQAYDIFKKSVHLLGAGDEFLRENGLDDISDRALTAINSALFDLCGKGDAQGLFEEINVSKEIADAASYGVAMFLSTAFGDAEKEGFFSKIYNDKRAKLKSKICRISDVLPVSGDAV